MSTRSSVELLLSLLHINTENPRYESTVSQKEAISEILSDQSEKIIRLAEDIIKNGLNPSELALVSASTSEKGFYNVLEGNRRVTALKLLDNPGLASPNHPKVTSKFKELKKGHKAIKKVACIVFENPDDANHWIKLKHTGENEGVGVVRWDSQQVARFESRTGAESNVALQAIEFLKNSKEVGSSLKSKLGKLPITNLDRLLTDKGIQDLLGISISKKRIRTHLPEAEIVKGLSKIVEDLVSKKIKVKDIYTKKDREKYIETFKKAEIPEKSKKSSQAWELTGDTQAEPPRQGSESSETKTSKRSSPLSTSRSSIIPRDCIIKIGSEAKVNKIYRELKNLDCDEFNNAGAILLRVFLELSADSYLSRFKVRGLGKDSELNKKLYGIAEEFQHSAILDKDELKGIRVATSNHNSIFSTNTFNSYVHNKSFSPIANDLKVTWDNIQLFMEKLWEKIESKST
jgi:hypothetical protein